MFTQSPSGISSNPNFPFRNVDTEYLRTYRVAAGDARKCYGYGNDFVDKYRHHPYNIVVKHKDRCLML